MGNPAGTWFVIMLVTCGLGTAASQASDFATLRRNAHVIRNSVGHHNAKPSDGTAAQGGGMRILIPTQIRTEPGAAPVGTYPLRLKKPNNASTRISAPKEIQTVSNEKKSSGKTVDSEKAKRDVCSAIDEYRKEMIEYAKSSTSVRKQENLQLAVSKLAKVFGKYNQDEQAEKLFRVTLEVVAKIHGGRSAPGTRPGDELRELQELLKLCN